eukprot:GGOE01036270.1.p2 GENE.GGOE01036270.1~~GGOE01036270.1.p2  ORF type:complete len:177 (-),score=48.21 GGOE01036270.1:305-811(-)
MTDDTRAAEIAAKVAALKAERAQKEAVAQAQAPSEAPAPTPATEVAAGPQDLSKYGTHNGIHCDGCAVGPIQGFRYKCKRCTNHDLCEVCHSKFVGGTLVQDSSMMRKNKVSVRLEDHDFAPYVDKDFQQLKTTAKAPAPKAKRVKPNDACPCGSGKKFKKCCDNPSA